MGRKVIVPMPEQAADMPEWYWFRGLHDAVVVDVAEQTWPVDYTQTVRRYNAPEISLDCRNAMMEQDISRITLYNCKVIAGDVSRMGGERVWWYTDRLERREADKWPWQLTVTLEEGSGERFEVVVRFEDVFIERRKRHSARKG